MHKSGNTDNNDFAFSIYEKYRILKQEDLLPGNEYETAKTYLKDTEILKGIDLADDSGAEITAAAKYFSRGFEGYQSTDYEQLSEKFPEVIKIAKEIVEEAKNHKEKEVSEKKTERKKRLSKVIRDSDDEPALEEKTEQRVGVRREKKRRVISSDSSSVDDDVNKSEEDVNVPKGATSRKAEPQPDSLSASAGSPRMLENRRNDHDSLASEGWSENAIRTNTVDMEDGVSRKVVKYVGISSDQQYLLFAGTASSESMEFDQKIAVEKKDFNLDYSKKDLFDPRKSYSILISERAEENQIYANETHAPALAQQYANKHVSRSIIESAARLSGRTVSLNQATGESR